MLELFSHFNIIYSIILSELPYIYAIILRICGLWAIIFIIFGVHLLFPPRNRRSRSSMRSSLIDYTNFTTTDKLYSALITNNKVLFDRLIDSPDIDFNKKFDAEGITFLMRAMWIDRSYGTNYFDIIITKQFIIDRHDIFGESELMYACEFHNLKACKYLIEHNANVNYQCNNGYTALIISIRFNRLDIAELLLHNGANPLIVDNDGKSALDYINECKPFTKENPKICYYLCCDNYHQDEHHINKIKALINDLIYNKHLLSQKSD